MVLVITNIAIAQPNNKYVSFSKGVNYSSQFFGTCCNDTFYFNKNILNEITDTTLFKEIKTNNHQLKSVVYDKNLYKYQYANGKLYTETIFFDTSTSNILQKKYFYYNQNNKIDLIKITNNGCCGHDAPIPADYAKFIYNKKGILEFVVLTIDKKIKHNDDISAGDNRINRDYNYGIKIIHYSYSTYKIIESQFYFERQVLNSYNKLYLYNLCKACTDIKPKTIYYTTPTQYNYMKNYLVDILYPVYNFNNYREKYLNF